MDDFTTGPGKADIGQETFKPDEAANHGGVERQCNEKIPPVPIVRRIHYRPVFGAFSSWVIKAIRVIRAACNCFSTSMTLP